MEGVKGILASKTIWGVLITTAFTLLDAFGINIGLSQDSAMELLTKAGELIGLVLAAYGRIVATKAIG